MNVFEQLSIIKNAVYEIRTKSIPCDLNDYLNGIIDNVEQFEYKMLFCNRCNKIISYKNSFQGPDGFLYCGCCINEVNIIKPYHHHKNKFEFLNNGEETPQKYRGFELEIETYELNSEITEILLDYTNEFNFEEDGSLKEGFEVISNPMSVEYWRNTGFNDLKDLITDLKATGNVYSWEKGRCGLHVHFNKCEWSNATYRTLIKLINDNPSYFETISGRKNFEYCRIPNIYDYNMRYLTNGDRYLAINFTEQTIEFRLFRGTLDLESIWCSIELCDCLLRYCEHITKNNTPLNWLSNNKLEIKKFEDWIIKNTEQADKLINFINKRFELKINNMDKQ